MVVVETKKFKTDKDKKAKEPETFEIHGEDEECDSEEGLGVQTRD